MHMTTMRSLTSSRRGGFRLGVVVIVAVASLVGAGLTLASDSPTITIVSGSPFGTGDDQASPFSIAFSPNGQFIATSNLSSGLGSDLGIFTVAANGTLTAGVGALLGGPGTVSAQQTMFSPNGQFVAVSESSDSNPPTAAWRSSPSTTRTATWGRSRTPRSALVASPTGWRSAPTVSSSPPPTTIDGTVSVFSVASDGELTQVTGSPFATTSGDSPYGLAFSPDGSELAVTLPGQNELEVFTVSSAGALTSTGTPVSTGAGTDPFPVVWSPLGDLVATGNQGGSSSVSMFSVGSGGALTLLSGYPENLGSYAGYLAFSPDGGLLAVDGPSRVKHNASSVGVYSVSSAGALTELSGSPYLPTGEFGPDPVAFSPGGGLLAAAVTGYRRELCLDVHRGRRPPRRRPARRDNDNPVTTSSTTMPTTTTPPTNVAGPQRPPRPHRRRPVAHPHLPVPCYRTSR